MARCVKVEAGLAPAEWIKGTLTIPDQVYMKKLIVSIKIEDRPPVDRIIAWFSGLLYPSSTMDFLGFLTPIP
jgi:hypothetical protein